MMPRLNPAVSAISSSAAPVRPFRAKTSSAASSRIWRVCSIRRSLVHRSAMGGSSHHFCWGRMSARGDGVPRFGVFQILLCESEMPERGLVEDVARPELLPRLDETVEVGAAECLFLESPCCRADSVPHRV